MIRHWRLVAFVLLSLICSTPSFGQAWSGILAPARATDWTQAGYPGGIPSATWPNCTTTACNTLYDGAVSASSINAAIVSAPNFTIVRVPAGTFTLTASVFSNRSNVVLRGAGPTSTTLVLNGRNILFGKGTGGQGSPPGGLTTTNLSTYTKGSTVLTVASTSALSAGQVVQIDQRNAAWINVNGNEGNQDPGRCSSPLSFQGCDGTRAQFELVQIQSVDSSTQITIKAPGLSQTYSAALSPQVFSWSSSGVASNAGIENLRVDAGDGSAGHAATNFAVALSWCNFCWVKNVAVINGHRAGIYSLWSYRAEIRDSYVSESNQSGAPIEYGIECDGCTLAKIENNILFGVTTPLMLETSYGTVVGYNYALNTASGAQFPTVSTHRAHNYMQLFEGNVAGTFGLDMIWGSGSHSTAFRNRLHGNDANKTNYRLPVAIAAWNRYMNLVGNVLGDPNFHSTYECTNTSPQPTNNFIYEIGFFKRCESGTTSYDSIAKTSVARWGNWDAVTWKANGNTNGVRYCTGSGAGNAACTASETASTDPSFPGLASPSLTFPASMYLTGKPSWWGAAAWPAIGPDVTGGNISGTGGHANKIPAQLCYEKTAKASGFLTAFDANACYTNITTIRPPLAPSGLTVTQ